MMLNSWDPEFRIPLYFSVTHMRTSISHLNGEREGAGPLSNLLAESKDLRNAVISNLGLEVLELVGLLGKLALDLRAEGDGLVNVAGNALEVLGAHTTGRHGGGTNADTARSEGRLVTGDGVLVAGNVDLLENGLNTSTIEVVGAEVDEDHVAVSAVRDELVAKNLELLLESLGVLDDLLLVLLELRGVDLLESNSQSSDGVVVGTTLVAREDGEVDRVLKVVKDFLSGLIGAADTLAEEDHGTTGTTERLVGGGGHNIGVLEGRGNDTSGDQARDVSHIDDEVGANLIGNLAHALVVNQTAVGRGTSDQTLGAVHLGVTLESVVVDDTGLKVNTVREGLEVGGNGRDLAGGGLVAVTQVTTVGEIQAHQAVVGTHESLVDLEVGGATRKALNVDAPLGGVEVEGLESTLLAGDLNGVDVLVATVVTSTGVTLGVLVAHGRTKSIEDSTRSEVLGGNQDD